MTGIQLLTKTLEDTGRTQAFIARRIGTTRQYVNGWDRVPKKWHKKVAELIDVQPEQLRPDLYEVAE